jgi:hypothetical protein
MAPADGPGSRSGGRRDRRRRRRLLIRDRGHVPPPATTRSSALAGPIDQLVLSAVRSQQSAPFRVSSRIIAL